MTLEQQAMNIITALPADKLSQVINFAKFLLTQPETDIISVQENIEKESFIRQPGILKGQIKIAADFDETPECFKEYI